MKIVELELKMELREDMSAAIMTASMTPRTPAGKSSFTSLTKAKLVQPPLKICPNAFYSRAGVILIPLNGKARLSIAVHLSDSSVFTLWSGVNILPQNRKLFPHDTFPD